MESSHVAMLSLGIAMGLVMPTFPSPVDIIRPYLFVIFLILGIVLFLAKK